MKLIPRKRYVFFNIDNLKIYAIRNNGYIRILYHNNKENYQEDKPWIDGIYKDLKQLCTIYNKKGELCAYYLYLRGLRRNCKIIELYNKKITIDNFLMHEFDGWFKKDNFIQINNPNECILRFHNRNRKIYALYTVKGDCLFGPYKYSTIEKWSNGVLIDEKFIVENNGQIYDVSKYKDLGQNIYFDRETNNYFILLDHRDSLLFKLEESFKDENIYTIDVDDGILKYNSQNNELVFETNDNKPRVEWTQEELEEAAEIAYEGYSRLELGLED